MESRTVNIVLVEDDVLDVMNVERAFGRANIQSPLFLARDGVEALELLRGDRVPLDRRVVLLDLNMPRLDGFGFLREMRADLLLQKTPVVVLTTSNDERDRTEAYRQNVAGYLLKSVDFSGFVELMTVLNQYWTVMEFP